MKKKVVSSHSERIGFSWRFKALPMKRQVEAWRMLRTKTLGFEREGKAIGDEAEKLNRLFTVAPRQKSKGVFDKKFQETRAKRLKTVLPRLKQRLERLDQRITRLYEGILSLKKIVDDEELLTNFDPLDRFIAKTNSFEWRAHQAYKEIEFANSLCHNIKANIWRLENNLPL